MKSSSSNSTWEAQQKRIRAVIKMAKTANDIEIMKTWGEYLQQMLQFPFEAIVEAYYEKGPLEYGDRLKVFRVEMADDHYGVIVACRKVRRRYDHPLAGLDVVDETSKNAQLVDDYRLWFANR